MKEKVTYRSQKYDGQQKKYLLELDIFAVAPYLFFLPGGPFFANFRR